MPPSDEESKLAIKFAQDIGYIKGTVKGIDSKTDSLGRKVESLEGAVNAKISSVHQSIAGLVRREDCAAHMAAVHQDLGSALAAATRAEVAAASAREEAEAAAGVAESAEAEAAEVREVTAKHVIPPAAPAPVEKPKPTLWERAVEHSKGLTSILIFLGMLSAGVVALAHFVGKVERTLSIAEESRKQEQAAIVKKLAEPPRVVYIRADKDGGVGNAAVVMPHPFTPEPKKVPGKKR